MVIQLLKIIRVFLWQKLDNYTREKLLKVENNCVKKLENESPVRQICGSIPLEKNERRRMTNLIARPVYQDSSSVSLFIYYTTLG